MFIMAVLQVRNMDDGLYEALGRRAAMENRSISQEVVAIIQSYLSTPGNFKCADDAVLNLAGTWEDRRSAKEIAGDIRKHRATRRFQETL
jgi:plasmid stability protein